MNMRNHSLELQRKQRGFSIIEALIAAVVVSVGLLGAAKFQAKMIKTGSTVKDRTLALSAANEYIEQYRVDYAKVMSDVPAYGSETPNISTGATGTLVRSWTITPNNTPNYNAVNVNVAWMDASGDNPSVALATYVNRGHPIMSGRLLMMKQLGYQPPLIPPTPPATLFDAVITGTIYKLNGNGQWSVSVDQGSCVTTASSYTCTLAGVPVSDSQNITIDFTATDVACGTTSVTVSLSVGASTSTQDFYHAANINQCP